MPESRVRGVVGGRVFHVSTFSFIARCMPIGVCITQVLCRRSNFDLFHFASRNRQISFGRLEAPVPQPCPSGLIVTPPMSGSALQPTGPPPTHMTRFRHNPTNRSDHSTFVTESQRVFASPSNSKYNRICRANCDKRACGPEISPIRANVCHDHQIYLELLTPIDQRSPFSHNCAKMSHRSPTTLSSIHFRSEHSRRTSPALGS